MKVVVKTVLYSNILKLRDVCNKAQPEHAGVICAQTPKSKVWTSLLRTLHLLLWPYFVSPSTLHTFTLPLYPVLHYSIPRTLSTLHTLHLLDPITFMSQMTLMVCTYMRLLAYWAISQVLFLGMNFFILFSFFPSHSSLIVSIRLPTTYKYCTAN